MAKRRRFDSKGFRTRHGMTSATQLADAVGVHERTVRNWDAGTVEPSRLAWQKLKELETERKAKQASTSENDPPDTSEPSEKPVRQGFLPSTR